MNYNPELPKVIRFEYRPHSGHLFIRCLFEEWPGREVEGTYGFQLSRTGVFFICPTRGKDHVLFPLGEAATAEEAVEIVKQFLKKWLLCKKAEHYQPKSDPARRQGGRSGRWKSEKRRSAAFARACFA